MKEVIILGRGQSRKRCPFDAECWTMAHTLSLPEINDYSKIHKVFGVDKFNKDTGIGLKTIRGVRIAKKYNIPVISTQDYGTEKYPLEEIVREFGINYFQPAASYMIAYAIYKGYEKLRLYGIDQGPDWEFLIAKPFVMFWLGVASGRGVKWELTRSSILLETGGETLRNVSIEIRKMLRDMRR